MVLQFLIIAIMNDINQNILIMLNNKILFFNYEICLIKSNRI